MINLVTLAVLRGKIRGLCIALSLAVGIFAESTAALAVQPQDNVRGFYDALLTTMRNGPTLGQSGRYARLAPVVDRVFDVPTRRDRPKVRPGQRSLPLSSSSLSTRSGTMLRRHTPTGSTAIRGSSCRLPGSARTTRM
jgi:hypothetical protein